MTERSDEDLMLAYKKGDPAAFEVLLKRHEKGVYGFALRFLNSRAMAEDVTQESFLRVIRASAGYKASASFRNYLYRIVRNLCLDLLRKKAKEGQETGKGLDLERLIDSIPDVNPGPELHTDARQTRLALYKALQSLPAEQREVFLLKEIKDMKLQDVAKVTGTNLNTVKSRLRYALFSLREQLSREWRGKEAGHVM